MSLHPVSLTELPLTPMTDGDVVRQAQAGSKDAMRQLYLRHAPVVYRVVHHATRSSELAKDFTQDSFIRAFADLASLRQPDAFRGWLLHIALARCRHWARREKLKRLLGIDGGGAVTESAAVTSHLRAEARAEVAKVLVHVRDLPAEEQQAWQLRYVEEFTLVEVAEALGCSLATAKRRLATAEAHLAKVVRREEEQPHGP